jgi:hypothetical protein
VPGHLDNLGAPVAGDQTPSAGRSGDRPHAADQRALVGAPGEDEPGRRQVAQGTAFVSAGTPDARQEPPRTLRSVVAGMLVGAVCATGVGVTCAVSGHPEISWAHGGVRVPP